MSTGKIVILGWLRKQQVVWCYFWMQYVWAQNKLWNPLRDEIFFRRAASNFCCSHHFETNDGRIFPTARNLFTIVLSVNVTILVKIANAPLAQSLKVHCQAKSEGAHYCSETALQLDITFNFSLFV